jgi:hypothetical protein
MCVGPKCVGRAPYTTTVPTTIADSGSGSSGDSGSEELDGSGDDDDGVSRTRRHDGSGSGSDSGSHDATSHLEQHTVNTNWLKGSCGDDGCTCELCACTECGEGTGPCIILGTKQCKPYTEHGCAGWGAVGPIVQDCCSLEDRTYADCCVDHWTYTFSEWTNNCPSADDTRTETEACLTEIVDINNDNAPCDCVASSKRDPVTEIRVCTTVTSTSTRTQPTVTPAIQEVHAPCGGAYGECADGLTCGCKENCWDPQHSDNQWTCCHEPVCCEALTPECLACTKKVSVETFCDRNMGLYGCPMKHTGPNHVLVRPYHDGATGYGVLASIQEFENQSPCNTDELLRDKWDLVLYGSFDLSASAGLNILETNSCFETISIVDNANNNPNTQLYELVDYMAENFPGAKYCVQDLYNTYSSTGWLEDLSRVIHNAPGFSVIGGIYAGPIWHGMSDTYKLHLDSNACYNPDHEVMQTLQNAGPGTTPFALALAELVFAGYDDATYETLEIKQRHAALSGYKADGMFVNFGINAFYTPSQVQYSQSYHVNGLFGTAFNAYEGVPVIIHGGTSVTDWPAPAGSDCDDSSIDMSLDLLVSSVNGVRWHDFKWAFEEIESAQTSCMPPLPFTNKHVIQHSEHMGSPDGWNTVTRSDSDVAWDMCSLEAASKWVMWVSTDLELHDGPIVVPVHQGVPINSFIDIDSPDCDTACRAAVMAEREHYPNCRKHVMAENPIFEFEALTEYCAHASNYVDDAAPSIDGYYCYIEANDMNAAMLVEAAVYQRPTQVMVPAANATVGPRSSRCNGGVCSCTDRAFTYGGRHFLSGSPCIKTDGMPRGICPTWINTKNEFVVTASDVTAWTEQDNEDNTGDWAYCADAVCVNTLPTVGGFAALEATIIMFEGFAEKTCAEQQEFANTICASLSSEAVCVWGPPIHAEHTGDNQRQRRTHLSGEMQLQVNPAADCNTADACTTKAWADLKVDLRVIDGSELAADGHVFTPLGDIKQQDGALFFRDHVLQTADDLMMFIEVSETGAGYDVQNGHGRDTTFVNLNILMPIPMPKYGVFWSWRSDKKEFMVGHVDGTVFIRATEAGIGGPAPIEKTTDIILGTNVGEWEQLLVVVDLSDETTADKSIHIFNYNGEGEPAHYEFTLSFAFFGTGQLSLGNAASHFGVDEFQIFYDKTTPTSNDETIEKLKAKIKYGNAKTIDGYSLIGKDAFKKHHLVYRWSMDAITDGVINDEFFAADFFGKHDLGPKRKKLTHVTYQGGPTEPPAFVDGEEIICGGDNNGRGIYQRTCQCEGKPLTRQVFGIHESLEDNSGYFILDQSTCVPPFEFYGWYHDTGANIPLYLDGSDVQGLITVHESAFENAVGHIDMSKAEDLVEVGEDAFKNVINTDGDVGAVMKGRFPKLVTVSASETTLPNPHGIYCSGSDDDKHKDVLRDANDKYCGACTDDACAETRVDPDPKPAPTPKPKTVTSSGGATKKSNTLVIIGGAVGGVVLVAVVGLIVMKSSAGGSAIGFTTEEAFALLF